MPRRPDPVIIVLASALALGLGLSIEAQRADLSNEPGTWKPWKMTVSLGARQSSAATPAEVRAFEAELASFREILRRAPRTAEPRGFSVEVWGHLAPAPLPGPGVPPPKTLPLAGGVTFGAFPIFEYERNGKIIREDTGETQLLDFMVNDISPATLGAGAPSEWRELDADVFFQQPATGERAGWPRYDDIIVMTKRSEPLWAPVTLEAACQLRRQVAQQALAAAREALEAQRKELDEFIDPARRAARQSDYEQTAPRMPDPQGFLKMMEESERVREDIMRKGVSPDGLFTKSVMEAEQRLAAIDARLAGLSDAEKNAPACYGPPGRTPEAQILTAPAADCRPLARPNWGFFDRSLPRSAPQIVIVRQARRCYEDARPTTSVAGCPANRALLESMDRQAVLDWLK